MLEILGLKVEDGKESLCRKAPQWCFPANNASSAEVLSPDLYCGFPSHAKLKGLLRHRTVMFSSPLPVG